MKAVRSVKTNAANLSTDVHVFAISDCGGTKFDTSDRFVFAVHIEKFSMSGTDTREKLSRICSKQGLRLSRKCGTVGHLVY